MKIHVSPRASWPLRLVAFVLALVAAGLFLTCIAHAQDAASSAAPAADAGTDWTAALVSFLAPLVANHPWASALLIAVGVLRSIFKPIVSVLEQRAAATADTADDERLKRAEASWWFRALAWFLDFGASIKVGPQKR